MKALYDYKPLNASDTTVTITSSPTLPNFSTANLKSIEPTKTWKSYNVSGSKFITYDAGVGNKFNIDSLFLNRFNFANFTIEGSDDAFATTPFSQVVTGCIRDEIYDANRSILISDEYMSYFAVLVAFNYRFLRLTIPSQVPLFETSYFKVGNMLIGNSVTIWNPKNGLAISLDPNINTIEFRSGYDSDYKQGKAFRLFDGEFDKMTKTEYAKIRNALNAFVLYTDWTGNPQDAYLVKNRRGFRKTYNMADNLNKALTLKEVV